MLICSYKKSPQNVKEKELNKKIISVFGELYPDSSLDVDILVGAKAGNGVTCLGGSYAFKDKVSLFREASKTVAELLDLKFVEYSKGSRANIDDNSYVFIINGDNHYNDINSFIDDMNKKIATFYKSAAGALLFDDVDNLLSVQSRANLAFSIILDKSLKGEQVDNLYVGLSSSSIWGNKVSNGVRILENRIKVKFISEDFETFKKEVEARYEDNLGIIKFLEDNPQFFDKNFIDKGEGLKTSAQTWKEIIDHSLKVIKVFDLTEDAKINIKVKAEELLEPDVSKAFFEHIDKRYDFEKKSKDNNSNISQRIKNILEKKSNRIKQDPYS